MLESIRRFYNYIFITCLIDIYCKEYDNEFKKFSKCGPSTNTKNTRVVLANLSVRADKRRLGLASKLTQKCESLAKVKINLCL